MNGIVELEKPIRINAVLAFIKAVYKPTEPLVKDDGYYGSFEYDYTTSIYDDWHTIPILLDYITPNYGGVRYFLVCRNCERRVTSLYLAAPEFPACRHCLKLDYGSRKYLHNSLLLSFCKLAKADQLTRKRLRYAGKPTRTGRRLNKYVSYMKEHPLPQPDFK